LRVLALMIVACATITPGAAQASSIFFIRSNEIWVANPDGSGAKQLTTDGRQRHAVRVGVGSEGAEHDACFPA